VSEYTAHSSGLGVEKHIDLRKINVPVW